MQILHAPTALREAVRAARRDGEVVALVPTMGALHEGHLSLVRHAREETDFVVVSVFVNPTQFGPNEDLDEYPRDLERDAELVAAAGADVVFAPDVQTMYPEGCSTVVSESACSARLEGERRPGHFDGVCAVCSKLFNLVQPDIAYFGHKDYQQTLVLRRMVRDLHMPIEVRVLPTVREADGLALSSRNQYLSEEERRQALSLHRALVAAREAFARGERNAEALRRLIRETIAAEPLAEIQYVSVAHPDTLDELDEITGEAVALVAVRIGEPVLIDNVRLAPGREEARG